MSSRPASPPPISRWPFYAGVALLVVLAAIILLYADRPFGAPVLVAALVCAGAGIVLGVAPEMIDYERRIRLAEAAVRDAADAQLRRLAQTADQLAHVVSRGQSTEEQAGRALGTLEEVAERMVAQAEELASALSRSSEREQAAHTGELQRLVDERDQKFAALEIRLNATTVALSEVQAAIKKTSLASTRAIEAVASRLDEVAAELRAAIAARPAVPESRPAAVPPPTVPPASASTSEGEPAAIEPRSIATPAPIAAPAPRAVVDSTSSAPVAVEPGTSVDTPVVDAAAPDSRPGIDSAPLVQSEPVSPRPPRRPRHHHTPVRTDDATSAPESEKGADAPAVEEPPALRPAAPLELALEGMPEPRPVMRLHRREPPGSTSLVATAYIGIGNKLYLRGDGPGLSWERGVPMQFLAIGKWGWTTTEASAPVTCRVYRNDDTPMLEENIVIDPGTKAEITPKF